MLENFRQALTALQPAQFSRSKRLSGQTARGNPAPPSPAGVQHAAAMAWRVRTKPSASQPWPFVGLQGWASLDRKARTRPPPGLESGLSAHGLAKEGLGLSLERSSRLADGQRS